MTKKPFHYRLLFSAASLLFSLALGSCTSGGMDSLKVLEGTWKGTQENFVFIETWKVTSPDAMTGSGCGLQEGDTVFTEALKIEKLGDEIFYIATVKENPGPVHFKLTNPTDNTFSFINKEHDFPQEILYEVKGKDTLHVTLTGMRDKAPAKEELFFIREK